MSLPGDVMAAVGIGFERHAGVPASGKGRSSYTAPLPTPTELRRGDVVPLPKTLIISRGLRISASVAATKVAGPPLRQGGKIALLLHLKMPKPLILQKCAKLYSYGL